MSCLRVLRQDSHPSSGSARVSCFLFCLSRTQQQSKHACFSSGSCGEAPACFPDASAQVAFSPPHALLPSVVVTVFPLGVLVSLPMLLWYRQGPVLRSCWWEGDVGRGRDQWHRLRLHSSILTPKPTSS